MRILIQSSKENQLIDCKAMMTVGGKESTGVKFSSLKMKEDYLVISPQNSAVSILPLKIKAKGPVELKHLESFECKDLKLTFLNEAHASIPEVHTAKNLDSFISVLNLMSDADSTATVFKHCLNYIISEFDFDRGLIIGLNEKEKYEVLSHLGTDPSSPWLSESLLAETLTKKIPLKISNIIGSPFEKNKSLMATGFMSVSTWPILFKNKVIGAIIVGSGMPHDGVSEYESQQVEALSKLMAAQVHSFLLEKKLKQNSDETVSDSPLTTCSQNVHNMLAYAKKAAQSDLSIYIHGETGTGKEVLAKWIHKKRYEQKAPFIAVNCAALPENLVESILFGHKKGSFTGALTDQVGKFMLAHGGTLFLDEIGELPLNVQSKLLRAIQERQIEPVGSKSPVTINTRIIVATHKNLKEMVDKGEFREDLYYRLSEVELVIPALRQRPSDVLMLAQEFVKENYNHLSFSDEAKVWLMDQRWPGNVRELLTALKKAALFCEGEKIDITDFQIGSNLKESKSWLVGGSLDTATKEFQQEKIKEALKRSGGNRTEASRILGVNPRTIFRHLEQMKEERLQQ